MKTFFVFAFSLVFLNLLDTEINNSGTIEVTVTNVESSEGQIRAVLFKGEEGFPEDSQKAFKSVSVPAREGKTVFTYTNIPYGEYAISLLHDKNSDGEMNSNMFGYPQEGYGVSNNTLPTFSMPKYEDAYFELKEGNKKLLIHLRN